MSEVPRARTRPLPTSFSPTPYRTGRPRRSRRCRWTSGPPTPSPSAPTPPQATICFDPFHVIKLATDALDDVRRQGWQYARTLSDKQIAKIYRGPGGRC
ncbi:transposase [Rhodococcus oxybenzonivorans]|uniref:transposase n=1 Tax=Rhodococcus oxybenzonivorans TaxID=1990687 RepID=UPI0037C9FCDC